MSPPPARERGIPWASVVGSRTGAARAVVQRRPIARRLLDGRRNVAPRGRDRDCPFDEGGLSDELCKGVI